MVLMLEDVGYNWLAPNHNRIALTANFLDNELDVK